MKNFINHIRQFVNFTDDEAAAFYNVMTEVHFKKGAHLLEQGSICGQVYFITKGTVIYFMKQDDSEIINEVFFENCWVTEYGSFLAKSPATKSIRAMDEVTVLALSYNNMQ
ncbi:MAG TPA: cyclic nucleotide-binding domain-containing protein, partial [Bacteroidia bacterium]|nr:cyclic nucleotide-binding domain-containing protein [Bacteroidia bacterium]